MRLRQVFLEDIFSGNPNEWDKINDIYALCGANHAKNYIFRKYGIKMRNIEIREALARPANSGAIYAKEAHKTAWLEAGLK
ncbi:hypothetical protein SDD30_01600 [Moorella naiadis]|uniref:hypothetical protein n=1 Tax=Moorella naiadis (nom. illeg.) TaxID=3093670 RepID=UPI003D9CB825